MNRTAIRRGLAVAFSGMAVAGIVAVSQPADAAPKSVTPPTSSPAPETAPAASAPSTASSRNGGGVSAAAQHLNGLCNLYDNGNGDFCLWYFQNYSGSHVDFYVSDNNLNDNTFNSPGAGQGAVVGNNSESFWNYDQYLTAQVYVGANYTGTSANVPPNAHGNFSSTFFNNVESFKWV